MTAYQADYSGYLDILRSLAADKGLLNFSPDDPVQVILKNIVNENKNALSATYILVKNLPVLGPILGPSECPRMSLSVWYTDVHRPPSRLRDQVHHR